MSDDVDTGEPEREPPVPEHEPAPDPKHKAQPETDRLLHELPHSPWGREGYSSAEVDEFVVRLGNAMTRQPPTMAPYEVADQRFKVTRFGQRYALEPVDEFLEQAEARLREVHGEDAVAHLEGRAPEPKHFPTGWIYLVALLLVAVMVAFLVTQL